MISFVDGPAGGQVLALRRAPVFLRVVCSPGGKWDALDQLEDQPHIQETLHAYVQVEKPTQAHISMRPRSASGWYWFGKYRFVSPQPSQDVMRVTEAWRNWCQSNWAMAAQYANGAI